MKTKAPPFSTGLAHPPASTFLVPTRRVGMQPGCAAPRNETPAKLMCESLHEAKLLWRATSGGLTRSNRRQRL